MPPSDGHPPCSGGYYNEIQVVATVVSSNNEVDSDIGPMIEHRPRWLCPASHSTGRSAPARVGYANGQYILNPTATS